MRFDARIPAWLAKQLYDAALSDGRSVTGSPTFRGAMAFGHAASRRARVSAMVESTRRW